MKAALHFQIQEHQVSKQGVAGCVAAPEDPHVGLAIRACGAVAGAVQEPLFLPAMKCQVGCAGLSKSLGGSPLPG